MAEMTHVYVVATAAAVCLLLTSSLSEAVQCYHCYDSFNKTLSVVALKDAQFGSKFVRCEKNKNNWNSWNCPAQWPVCLIMHGKVDDHYEVLRTCGEADFCSKYKPPVNVKLELCQECNTTLCNDYPKFPDPPVGPVPSFTFNFNINLKLNKYTTGGKNVE